MKTLKFNRAVVISRGRHSAPGETAEVEDKAAGYFVARGIAEEVEAAVAPPEPTKEPPKKKRGRKPKVADG